MHKMFYVFALMLLCFVSFTLLLKKDYIILTLSFVVQMSNELKLVLFIDQMLNYVSGVPNLSQPASFTY